MIAAHSFSRQATLEGRSDRTEGSAVTLQPPVEPMLAQTVESVPGPSVLGELAFEQKFDDYRALLFTPTGAGGRLLVQTRRGTLVQDRFPDLVAAADQLPDGLVLDGELVVWDPHAGQLSFEALQRRAAARGRSARSLAASLPAFFIAFDILQQDMTELLNYPYRQRRARLDALFTTHRLSAPWTLCPMTTDLDKAKEWLESWTDVSGVEGIVVKAMNQPYRTGYRGWYKLRRRDTTEAIIGAITGTLNRPQLLLLGRHNPHGHLRPIGRKSIQTLDHLAVAARIRRRSNRRRQPGPSPPEPPPPRIVAITASLGSWTRSARRSTTSGPPRGRDRQRPPLPNPLR
ncbi:ATP-dependent DNA ligase [Streptomyces sp. NPDC048258]|uniref:ATP-dependent DNA ligase n=1 Tax=Streptomyces sp. NPDC048258 TaxID=3365527 RepID=UPI00371F7E7A